ncbi:MAG: single-stranded DNA-binding protein [Bacteroidetes bacterium]|nr:MAG: single-stranded DNA-binding protein [Bacteroidota bacterium]
MTQLQNHVQLIGNLGQAPERIATKNDIEDTMVRFRLATNETYLNKNNERIENTQWHNCVIFGKKAEIIEQYCDKGSKLAVQGKISYRQYQDKDGVNRIATNIQVYDFMFLDNKSKQ